MGRSRENLKRKRSLGSKDSGYHAKRHFNCSNYRSDRSTDDKSSQSTSDVSLQSTYNVITYNQVPYHSWLTYFYNQEYNEKSSTVVKIDAFIDFFVKNPSTTYDVEIGLNIDINLCINDSDLRLKWPSIIEDLKNNPHHTLNCINAAFFEVMMQRAIKEDRGNVERVFKILRMNRINILNSESINPLPCVKLSSHGKLISTSGIIIGMGRTKLSSDSIVFACECNRQILSKPRNETTSIPKKCNICGNARMQRLLDSPYGSTEVSQYIYIKDYRTTEESQNLDDGTISPNIISVRLTRSLVDKFMTGDKIRIIGIPRVTLGVVKSSTSGSNPLYIDAKSVFKDDDISYENSNTRINWSAIEKIRSEPDILSLLVNSLCPSVQGHEIIKAALVLGLFAGTSKSDETRDYIHVLIIGNLGLGKSQLLRACAQIAPEGTYVRGSSTTSLGSTMTAVRESFTDDYRLEAGSLALANSGFLCLDEFDKMSNQHQIIYNAMMRQRVDTMNSEFKHCHPSRNSIFAMTDSTKKRYDPSKTLVENVNTSKQLLGQFDLIFLMRDNPDTYLDKLMCDRVLKEHTKRSDLTQQTEISDRRKIDEPRINVDRTLRERLVTPYENGTSDLLPAMIFRAYINYARFNVKPTLSKSSKIIIERFCSLRRNNEKNFGEFERYMRTLVILSEARAKIDLRVETSERDVLDSIEILEQSMSIDVEDIAQPRSSGSTNKITANKIKQFLEDLEREALQQNKNIFTPEELGNIAGQENMTGNTLSLLLSKLNEQGYILKISSNSYKVFFH